MGPKPRKIGPEGWGPEGWGGPKFHVFSLPPQFSFFLPSLGCLLVEFWWCLKRWDPQMCTFGNLGLTCEDPSAGGGGRGGGGGGPASDGEGLNQQHTTHNTTTTTTTTQRHTTTHNNRTDNKQHNKTKTGWTGGRGRLQPISTSASFFFRVRPIPEVELAEVEHPPTEGGGQGG